MMVGAKVGVMQPGSTERRSLQELKRQERILPRAPRKEAARLTS